MRAYAASATPHKGSPAFRTLPAAAAADTFAAFPAVERGIEDIAMIDLYALTSPNVQKIYIMLEETKLPYREHFVDVWKSEQYDPGFLKINPNGKIPAIVDDDGPGGKPITIFESGAILMYLAEKTGQFMPKDPVKRYEALQWLMIQIAGIGPMFGQRVHFRRFAPPGNDYGVIRYGTEVQRLYDLIEERLATRPYICGDEYTIVDIATFPWLRNNTLLDIDISNRPNVKRYIDAISARPAVKATLAKVGAIKSNRDTASDDQKDRFFNRGKYARA